MPIRILFLSAFFLCHFGSFVAMAQDDPDLIPLAPLVAPEAAEEAAPAPVPAALPGEGQTAPPAEKAEEKQEDSSSSGGTAIAPVPAALPGEGQTAPPAEKAEEKQEDSSPSGGAAVAPVPAALPGEGQTAPPAEKAEEKQEDSSPSGGAAVAPVPAALPGEGQTAPPAEKAEEKQEDNSPSGGAAIAPVPAALPGEGQTAPPAEKAEEKQEDSSSSGGTAIAPVPAALPGEGQTAPPAEKAEEKQEDSSPSGGAAIAPVPAALPGESQTAPPAEKAEEKQEDSSPSGGAAVAPVPAALPGEEPNQAAQGLQDTQESDNTKEFLDPEFGFLPPPSENEPSSAVAVKEEGWKPEAEWGGEFRSRLGLDLANEYSIIEPQTGPPKAVGTEDVVDFRNSVQFWSRIKLTEKIQAFLEVYAEYAVMGKRNEDHPTLLFNGKDYRWDFRLEPWEIYFDFFFDNFDLRVGNQVITWGTLAFTSPSDRVNYRDIRAYSWSDVTGSRMPTPALKGVYHVSGLNFEAVWLPFFFPPPNDLYGGDFSLLRYDSVYGYLTSPMQDIDRYIDESMTAPGHPDLLQTRRPDASPVNSQAGFRFSGSKAGVDFGLSYLFSFEELPTARFDPEVKSLARAVASGDTNMANGIVQSLLSRIDSGENIRSLADSRYERRHSVAAEFGTTVWELGVKAETAFFPGKTYYTRDFEPVTHHTLAYAGGIDVIKTDLGAMSTFYLDIELFGSALFGMKDGEALSFNSDLNLGLHATLRMAFLSDDLEFEITDRTHFHSKDYVLIPKVSYRPVEDLRLTLGFMLLESWRREPAGFGRFNSNTDSKDSLFGQYSNNDQVFFMLRYSF